MIAVDTNVLVYAHRTEFALHHAAAGRLTQLAEGPSPWGVPVFCLGEFIRVVTHRRVLTPPSSLDEASAFIDAITLSPTFRLLLPDASYWYALKDVVSHAGASGNLAFDAQIAAVCRSQGATLLTADRDFSRFALETERLLPGP